MTDDKIINLFKTTGKPDIETGKEKFFRGFAYVKLTKDLNGNKLNEESLREYANKCCYLVSVMKKNLFETALYQYNVPYESLLEFCCEFEKDKSYGEIIDIEKYMPDDPA